MAGLFVHGVADRFLGWVNDGFGKRPNTLDFLPRDEAGGWGDPNQLFRHGYWTLTDDEALVIDAPAIDAYYWNFQLNNLWEESLDYRYFQITVNKLTATYEADGSARIIVASSDPGVGNWIADEVLYQARIDPRRLERLARKAFQAGEQDQPEPGRPEPHVGQQNHQ